MSDEAKLSLKVLINKQKSKVIFAEANSHVVDILLSFLTLPLGKIVRILEKHYGGEAPVIGSLSTLYKGLVNLDVDHFSSRGAKQMLVDPRSSWEAECRRLILDSSDSQPTTYFVCQDLNCRHTGSYHVSLYPDKWVCECGKMMSAKLVVGERLAGEEGGVFTSNTSSFIISDDLRVVPNVTGFVQTLNNLGIADTDGKEMKSWILGMKNIMDLLKCALISTTPLTDLFISSGEVTPSAGALPHPIKKKTVSDNSKKTLLKVSLQKATGKFLYAKAEDDFVELLFSFLSIPLGAVECILGGVTGLTSIDNLYKSVAHGIDDEYFETSHTKNRLINPKLPHGYITDDQILPLSEESPPQLYCYQNDSLPFPYIYSHKEHGSPLSFCEVTKFMERQRVYIVRDDLTATPYSIGTIVLILNGLGVPERSAVARWTPRGIKYTQSFSYVNNCFNRCPRPSYAQEYRISIKIWSTWNFTEGIRLVICRTGISMPSSHQTYYFSVHVYSEYTFWGSGFDFHYIIRYLGLLRI